MEKLLEYVKLLEGKSNRTRGKELIGILKSKGHDFLQERYGVIRQGVNIVLEFGRGKKEILATAHYDKIPWSPGANDNASSVSVLLDFCERIRNHNIRNKIKVIFFNDEEPFALNLRGCLGSRKYIEKHGLKNIAGVYNLEMVGMGDSVGIWPVTEDVKDDSVLNNLRNTLNQLGIYFEEAGRLPMFYSDHRSFRERGFKSAFCITIVSYKDRHAVRHFIKTGIGALLKSSDVPLIFKLYHSPRDKSKYLTESALKLTSDILYNAIINLDKKT